MMGSMDTLLAGLAHVFSWPGILIPTAGTLLAMVASFVPGLGNASLSGFHRVSIQYTDSDLNDGPIALARHHRTGKLRAEITAVKAAIT